MNKLNPKNLRRGQLITVIAKPGKTSSETILRGDRLRVMSVCRPLVYVERWSPHTGKFSQSPWNVEEFNYDILRLHKNAITPIE